MDRSRHRVGYVVVGVFIGIQASELERGARHAARAENIAERLKADVREEDWAHQLQIAYNREVLANANRAASALEGATTISDEALLVSAYRATQYKEATPPLHLE